MYIYYDPDTLQILSIRPDKVEKVTVAPITTSTYIEVDSVDMSKELVLEKDATGNVQLIQKDIEANQETTTDQEAQETEQETQEEG